MQVDFASLVGLVAALLGGWLATRLIRPKDHERAQMLSTIARDAAALVVSLLPNAEWATLLKAVVDRTSASAGTSNRDAIENAAAGALTALGKNPNVK